MYYDWEACACHGQQTTIPSTTSLMLPDYGETWVGWNSNYNFLLLITGIKHDKNKSIDLRLFGSDWENSSSHFL